MCAEAVLGLCISAFGSDARRLQMPQRALSRHRRPRGSTVRPWRRYAPGDLCVAGSGPRTRVDRKPGSTRLRPLLAESDGRDGRAGRPAGLCVMSAGCTDKDGASGIADISEGAGPDALCGGGCRNEAHAAQPRANDSLQRVAELISRQ